MDKDSFNTICDFRILIYSTAHDIYFRNTRMEKASGSL